MPAMPIALSSAPIVVGINATSSAISAVTEISVCAKRANGRSVDDDDEEDERQAGEQDVQRDLVGRLAPLGTLDERDHPIEERLPGLLRDLDDDPVAEHAGSPRDGARSPPDSRMTGADSPVIADSSTEAMPSTTVPSPGMTSPASTTTTSPRCSSDAGFVAPSRSTAVVVVRIARSASAWALPRPSASASARFAKTTVSHSQTVTVNVNHAGSSPPPSELPPKNWMSHAIVVIDGADLDDEHDRVADLHARVELAQRADDGGADQSRLKSVRLVRSMSSGHLVQGEVEFA